MKNYYPTLYYRFGRTGSPHEYNWMEDSRDFVEELRLDILKINDTQKLVFFLIQLFKVDTFSILFLNCIGNYKKIDSRFFSSTRVYSKLIKSFVANNCEKTDEQLCQISFVFKEALDSCFFKKNNLKLEKNRIIKEIDSDITLVIEFIQDEFGQFNEVLIKYRSDSVTNSDSIM